MCNKIYERYRCVIPPVRPINGVGYKTTDEIGFLELFSRTIGPIADMNTYFEALDFLTFFSIFSIYFNLKYVFF